MAATRNALVNWTPWVAIGILALGGAGMASGPARDATALGTAHTGAALSDTARVELRSGGVVSGQILKQTPEAVWIDLGHDVVKIPAAQIAKVERDEASEPEATREETPRGDALYVTRAGGREGDPEALAERLGGAVFKVTTPAGTGSAFIVHPDGFALTNAHVVQGETKIGAVLWRQTPRGLQRETLDDVKLVAVNNFVDLALVRLPARDDGVYPIVPLAPDKELATGQSVFAIGAPQGLERSLSRGVVSTTDRGFEGLAYIQTDTAINPGNSGGPLFDLRGRVVGVTNMGRRFSEGLNFAIPVRYVRDFLDHRSAFAYDETNPNSGYTYNEAPRRTRAGAPERLRSDR